MYYVVDQDLSRGDRRSDGPALSNFFIVEGGSTTVNNVREIHRLKNRMELAPTVTNESHDSTTDELLEYSLDAMRDKPASEEGPLRKKNVTALTNVRLRPPKAGIRCAGRNDTTRQLWLNEFYVVHEGMRRKGKKYVCLRGLAIFFGGTSASRRGPEHDRE
jgi:hypothetical protein